MTTNPSMNIGGPPPENPNPSPAPTNVPLTDKQKLQLANIHRRMLDKRLASEQMTREADNLQTLLQRELAGVAMLNNIDFTKFALSEDFEITPLTR